MKNLPNQDPKSNRDRMLDLYDAAPYPEVLADKMPQGTPLLVHWVNSVVAPDGIAIHPTARILVAGCGSGAEVIGLAQRFPHAQLVGVDFSPKSIERAQAYVKATNTTNTKFEVADLTLSDWCEKYPPFDFILCHGVADYVSDVSAMMRTFAHCLAPCGVLCMTVNSPSHPAGRLREAFATLGVPPASFEDSPEQRSMLRMMAQLMGKNAEINDLGNAQTAYLNVDIFAPIAQHLSIGEWCQQAKEAGLSFCGSMDALMGLTELQDEQLPLLYALGRPQLSLWMAELRQRPGMQLLFSPRKPIEPNFEQPDLLWEWKPRLDACVGALPELAENPSQPLTITLRFPGLPDFIIYSTAYDLEVLRRCDGVSSLREILAAIPAQGHLDRLRIGLFRAYHFGILGG